MTNENTKQNTPTEQNFFTALVQGDVDQVRQLVEDQPELLTAYDYKYYGATPVTRICSLDNRPVLETLLKSGADVNQKSDWSMGPWSPMHCAVFDGNDELAEFFLKHGAELDAHSAAGLGMIDELTKMLDSDPKLVEQPGGDGCQPLHFAKSIEVAQLLLDRGADINARCVDHYSTPAQYLATKRGEVCRFLFAKGAEADIFSAIMANDSEVVQRLLEEDPSLLKARVNRRFFPAGPEHDVDNIMTFTVGLDSTAMHAAARGNRPDMVKVLVAAGQSPDVTGGYDESTALHVAAWHNQVEVAKALLECGADGNKRSGAIHNNSPAGWAIVAGSADFFEFMMDQNIEVLEAFSENAKAGVAGHFNQYANASRESRQRILDRLDSAGPQS